MEFTKEELIALHNIIEYACKDLTLDDEPLLDILYEKTRTLDYENIMLS